MHTEKILLGVNIDHVATLRQARFTSYPDPVEAGLLAEKAGADSITLHLREDRRHIQEDDVRALRLALKCPMNLEMAMTPEMTDFAIETGPQFSCIVPERREELTTEGGLDVAGHLEQVRHTCERLHAGGIRVSLFIDPDNRQILAAANAGAKVIELHTGDYANASGQSDVQRELDRLRAAAEFAHKLGLQVNAGHGLNYENVQSIAAISDITELNIGHSIIARAVFSGISEAVREMKQLMQDARK